MPPEGLQKFQKHNLVNFLNRFVFSSVLLRAIFSYWPFSHYVQNIKVFLVALSCFACFPPVIEIINLIGVMGMRIKIGGIVCALVESIWWQLLIIIESRPILAKHGWNCISTLPSYDNRDNLEKGQPIQVNLRLYYWKGTWFAHYWLNQCC